MAEITSSSVISSAVPTNDVSCGPLGWLAPIQRFLGAQRQAACSASFNDLNSMTLLLCWHFPS